MSDADLAGAGSAASAQRPPAAEDTPDSGSDPRIAELEAHLAEARTEAEKAREDWLRARAETDNVRRRAQEDVAKAHRFGQENFANALLPVKDSLDAALAVESASVDSYREGVELTARQLVAAFEKHAIKEVVPQGEKFDPHRHQAISQVESEQEPGTVVSVLQKGYMLHDRVLRPALVIVSKSPSPES